MIYARNSGALMTTKKEKTGADIDGSQTLTFEQLCLMEKCYPQHVFKARLIISNFLGYIPSFTDCGAQLPFLQTLIHQYYSQDISIERLTLEVESHLRPFRNEQHLKEWWVTKQPYDSYDFDMYNTELTEFKTRARATVSEMAYSLNLTEFPLEQSLHGEMLLRRVYASDMEESGEEFWNNHFFVFSAIAYRRLLITEGLEAANNVRLLGQILFDNLRQHPLDFLNDPAFKK